MKLCDYGCGQEAKHQLKNGKWCCSKSVNSCPGYLSIRPKKRKIIKPKKCNIYHKCDYGCGQNANYIFNNGKYCCSLHWKKCKNQKTLQHIKYEFINVLNKIIKSKIVNEYKKIEKLCDYGCGNKGNYLFKNDIWCCEKYAAQCPILKAKNKKNNTGKNNHFYKKIHKLKSINLMKIHSTHTIETIKKKHLLFSKIEEIRYNPDKPEEKEIQVHCKNHNCPNSKEQGGWFTPTKPQIYERIRQIENEDGNGGCYFYCSETCKQQCPLYHFHGTDPFKEKSKTLLYAPGELQTWKTQVKKLDNSTCQICGSKKNIHVHHIIPQKLEPFFALDPVNGICLCEKCHYKYGHKTNTECSTKNLASKTCIGDLYEATNYGC